MLMDLSQAGQMHSEWKIKFRMAIAKQETLDAANISSDRECPLGKWLHGEAKGKFDGLPAYADCVIRHATFHQEAGKVAQTINAKNFSQAKTMMNANTPYALAANNFIISLGMMKKEAGL
jgi:methyl-accepting chemotaxis protein